MVCLQQKSLWFRSWTLLRVVLGVLGEDDHLDRSADMKGEILPGFFEERKNPLSGHMNHAEKKPKNGCKIIAYTTWKRRHVANQPEFAGKKNILKMQANKSCMNVKIFI